MRPSILRQRGTFTFEPLENRFVCAALLAAVPTPLPQGDASVPAVSRALDAAQDGDGTQLAAIRNNRSESGSFDAPNRYFEFESSRLPGNFSFGPLGSFNHLYGPSTNGIWTDHFNLDVTPNGLQHSATWGGGQAEWGSNADNAAFLRGHFTTSYLRKDVDYHFGFEIRLDDDFFEISSEQSHAGWINLWQIKNRDQSLGSGHGGVLMGLYSQSTYDQALYFALYINGEMVHSPPIPKVKDNTYRIEVLTRFSDEQQGYGVFMANGQEIYRYSNATNLRGIEGDYLTRGAARGPYFGLYLDVDGPDGNGRFSRPLRVTYNHMFVDVRPTSPFEGSESTGSLLTTRRLASFLGWQEKGMSVDSNSVSDQTAETSSPSSTKPDSPIDALFRLRRGWR